MFLQLMAQKILGKVLNTKIKIVHTYNITLNLSALLESCDLCAIFNKILAFCVCLCIA